MIGWVSPDEYLGATPDLRRFVFQTPFRRATFDALIALSGEKRAFVRSPPLVNHPVVGRGVRSRAENAGAAAIAVLNDAPDAPAVRLLIDAARLISSPRSTKAAIASTPARERPTARPAVESRSRMGRISDHRRLRPRAARGERAAWSGSGVTVGHCAAGAVLACLLVAHTGTREYGPLRRPPWKCAAGAGVREQPAAGARHVTAGTGCERARVIGILLDSTMEGSGRV